MNDEREDTTDYEQMAKDELKEKRDFFEQLNEEKENKGG